MRNRVAKSVAAVLVAAMPVVAQAAEVKPSDVAIVEGEVAASLTGQAGDAAEGRKVFSNRKLGNCLACHMNAEMPEQTFHGEVGPPLDGVADRWTAAQMRAILTNSRAVFEDTIMPSFYRDSGYNRTLDKFEGKTILSAQQVEDVIAYLQTLKE